MQLWKKPKPKLIRLIRYRENVFAISQYIDLKRKAVDFSMFMEEEEEQLQKSLQKQQKIMHEKANVEETVKNFIESNSKIEETNKNSNQEDFSIVFDIKKPKDDKISKF